MLRVRHAPAGTWPLLFERVAVQQIPAQDVAALHRALLRARAFEIPSWLEGAPSTGGSPLTLRLQSRGAFRQIGAAGRVEDRLTRTLRSIDRWSPIRLGPWPDWLAGLFDESDPRPEIPVDREHALRMHRAWSPTEPRSRPAPPGPLRAARRARALRPGPLRSPPAARQPARPARRAREAPPLSSAELYRLKRGSSPAGWRRGSRAR
jgi:hypothetical protein